ncbi:hypothetical protein RJ55_08020 [Drechmeria coniospora]|nr:hypothetical protein RJ55_08020 [Drechmeria coniospora]
MMDPGGTNPGFNFTFIIYLIICGLLTIFFLLYFNRLFGSIVSYVIRTYTWHRYRIYIDIRALQISLLGGRVFFTGLRYHGFNETFLVQHGDITWRYWLRRVRESDIRISRSATEVASADREKNDSLPCRINVKLVGLEWFVYNRSPAYESILANLVAGHSPASPHSSNLFDEKDGVESKHAETQTPNAPADASSSPGNQSRRRQTSAQTKTSHNSGPGPVEAHSRTNSSSVGAEDQDKSAALPFFLQLLPIHVECTKPALVMGNDNTKAILIVKANTANVDVDASESKTCDRYMQMFKVQLNRAVIEMKENDAFKEDQDSRATRQREDAQASEPPPQRSFLRRYRRKAISSLRNMVPYWRRSVESFSADSRGFFGTGPSTIPASGQWQGLSRYLDDQYLDDKSRWASAEYAAVPTILDSPEATLTLYWDAVSRVTEQAAVTRLSSSSNNVNGSTPPAWGINVSVKGGTMNYGPWADRQRADLQRVFFPSIAKDASPAVALPAGAWRVATQFKMLVELEDAITLRIPIREQSRNWRWRGKEPPIRHLEGLTKRRQRNKSKKNSKGEGSSARPAGWLEIKVPANATVAYTMDMLAKPSGYENHLDIDLPSTELWSSVNHDILWKSGPQRISCDLSNPLPWNTLRSWHFTVDCDDMKLYLLRDHVFLLTDLVDDWASGPPSEYLVFTPYKYYLHLNLRRVQLFVNVNDENIIDKPTALDDNAYLILATPLLNTELTIPLDQFRPNKTTIPFDIRTNNVELSLHTPQSSTHAAFLSSNELGYAEALVVSGSYQYNSTTSPANTDTLVVKVHGQSPYAYLYGFVIRYLLLLKDNYFGDHVHFKTLDEYQDQLQAKEQGTKSSPGPPSKKSNDLDIILALKVDDPRIMLPINLYSAGRYVQCELASVSIDLRFTNYYMDMELDVSPLSLSIGNHGNTLESPSLSYSNTQLFIDGVRVSGHRAFGLPPSEPTYLCNWDVAVGDIDGECTPDFLASLAKGGAAFAFTFDDVENALVPYSSLVFYDITFVHLSVNCVNLRVHIDEAAFLLSTGPISVNSNDWARSHYSKKAVVTIPGIEISCVDAESASRHKSLHQHPVKTMAFFKTDIHLTTIGRKFGFTQERKVQQDLVRREDQRTSRIPFLLLEGLHDDFVPDLFDPPAQCSPLPLPYPVLDVDNEKRSYQGSSAPQRSQGLKSQRSFLSLSGSSGSSVLSRQNRPEGRAKSKGLLTTDELNASPPYDRMNDSASSSHQSASRMEMGEPSVKDVHDHNSVAFSSQYFAPHFPLRDVQPDTRDAAFPNEREVSYDEIFQQATADLDDIDPQDLTSVSNQRARELHCIFVWILPKYLLLSGQLHCTEPKQPSCSKSKVSWRLSIRASASANSRLLEDDYAASSDLGNHGKRTPIEKTVERANSTLPEVPAFKGPLTVVNLCCSDAAIHLNWELCELADDVLALYNQNKAQHLGEPKTVKLPDQPRERTLSAIHVVLEVVKGSLDVETVNLASKTLVTSRLHSQADLLGMFQLRQPSVFLSHELEVTDNVPLRTIKATASSQGMVLAVKQDLIVLLEVLDRLVLDEAAQLHRLLAQLPETPRDSGTAKVVDRLSKVRINAAVFLDGYSITIPLLESLTYKITGVVARVSCAANYGQELIFDFDVKENSHEVQIDVRNEPRSISLFHIPPTNGRIMNRTNQSENALTVSSSVEVIQVDASAIYSLLAALNRPQVSNATREVQDQASLIQEHISDVFRPSKPASPKVNSMPQPVKLAYNVHVTLAGLQILAQTALKSTTEPRAQILFSLDQVYLQVCNQPDPSAPALEYPELRVNLRQIGLDIRRGRDGAMRSCGSLGTSITVSASPCRGDDRTEDWQFNFHSDDLDVNLSPETVSTVIDVVGYMGSKIKELDTSRELEYLRKLRQSKPRITINDGKELGDDTDILDSVLSSVVYNFELRSIRVCWDVADVSTDQDSTKEDLVLSIQLIEFGTRTRKSARLTIENLQLQTVSPGQDKNVRSPHSALLPQVIFNVAYMSTAEARRMAFQATGESLDLRLTSGFIVPAANLVESISLSMKNVQNASAQWTTASTKKKGDAQPSQRQRSMLGNKRLENLLVDADFAGAVVYISSKGGGSDFDESQDAKYDEPDRGAVLRSPGLAWKAEYRDNGEEDPSLHGEVKIDASSNILYPCVVPLVLDMMSNMKRVVSESSKDSPPPQSVIPKLKPEKSADEDNILAADPSAVLGRLRLNLGLRICRQEFSLSCQPFARVAATTCYDNVYFTINTVTSQEQGNFFAISGTLTKPRASVQHVYSRESTASFELETVTLSFMNSKHVSGTTGVSAILKVSPMKVSVNAKQLQDFLLFREIWYPEDLRRAPMVPVAKLETETSQGHLVQRYQQVAATAAFPWTATISIAALDVNVDLGQAIGKSVFRINDFWVSSKKTSDWEQTLCLGFDKISVDCAGRLSGFVALQDFRLRTSIQWPQREEALNETPLIQASLGFNALRVKAAFDYQAFLVADITSLEFLMYNVRQKLEGAADRLVAIFDGDAVQVFGTATSAAQGLALYQAVQKLIQERKENFEASLRDMEKLMKRTSNPSPNASRPSRPAPKLVESDSMAKSPISLDTDVVVTLKALNLGVFPGTFSDHQVFKMEALNAYARFAASVEQRRIHSILRMTLGQLRIGLAGVRDVEAPKTLSEMTVEDVVQRSTGSRGGTILKVPRVEAVMETWQAPNSNHIDYIFKSAFEGKVEVGWNYSRVSYIRGMWANHSKSLEQTWGRQLPMAAVKITGVPEAEKEQQEGEQQKITAEVHVPQSKYEYQALEPPIIETPQLRDMGEATPPLEWIGLHRDKLPNLTHQIAIVSLLELAGEVEDAYSRILGSS